MATPKPRRIVLINPRFQLRLAAAFLAVQVVLTGLFAAGIFLVLDSELSASLSSAHARAQSLERMLLPIVAVLSGFSLALSTVLVTAFVVLLSHRLAGPMHRFRSVLDQLAARQLHPSARIRPEDQLEEVAQSLQGMVTTVSADLEALAAAAEEAKRCAGAAGDPATLAAIGRLEAILAAWHRPG